MWQVPAKIYQYVGSHIFTIYNLPPPLSLITVTSFYRYAALMSLSSSCWSPSPYPPDSLTQTSGPQWQHGWSHTGWGQQQRDFEIRARCQSELWSKVSLQDEALEKGQLAWPSFGEVGRRDRTEVSGTSLDSIAARPVCVCVDGYWRGRRVGHGCCPSSWSLVVWGCYG